jgi:hypothetical protein
MFLIDHCKRKGSDHCAAVKESNARESRWNMGANKVRMCRERLFHFLNIPAASESDQTPAGITTESGGSDHILPHQSLGLSRSVDVFFKNGTWMVLACEL